MLEVYISIATFSVLTFHYLYTRWLHPKRCLPPGPTRIPLIGNVHQIPLEYPQETFADWAKKYGNVIYAQIFQKPAIILNTVQAAQDLMEKRGSRYSDRPNLVLLNEFLFPMPLMVTMPYGDEWRRQRKWFQTSMETKSNLELYAPLQIREVDKLLSEIIETPSEFNRHLKRFAGALMLEVGYGHRVTSVEDEFLMAADEAVTKTVEAGSLVATLVDFFPILKYIPTWMPGGGFKRDALVVRGMLQATADTPFEGVRTAMMSGAAKASFTTFMIEDCAQNGQLTAEDERNIKGAAFLMYAAGSDTTITTLTTFVLAMVLHPDAFRKAQAEIDRVIGTERLPRMNDRDSLPYVESVVREVYRWNPPIPLGVPHRVIESDDYHGYLIPKGSMVISNLWSMGRDSSVYPDPETFRPERFEEMDDRTASGADPRKFVFGFGRRICPGRFLADSSIWLVAANMLATLDIHKARDSAGREITPVPHWKTGAVSHTEPFVCEIRPRTQAVADMVAQRVSEQID